MCVGEKWVADEEVLNATRGSSEEVGDVKRRLGNHVKYHQSSQIK